MFRLVRKSLAAALMACLCLWIPPLLAGKSAKILIVANASDVAYRATIAGFKQSPGIAQSQFTEISPAQASGSQEIVSAKPDVIFALGTESIAWASKQTSTIPIVGTLVLKPDALRVARNVTGISLGYSLQTQFQWLKKFFPEQSSVAILYNPAENATTVDMAKAASQQVGMKLIPIPVTSPKELPFALSQLEKNVEILLSIPDDTAMSAATAKEVLLASFRNKVPLVGLSDNWVKSGAFYALSWDYQDLGTQCAALAEKIVNGAAVQSLPPQTPRKVTYTINAKIAEHMSMEIPDSLLKNAKEVFN